MPILQDDLLEIYNSLVMFSDDIIKSKFPLPLRVRYEKESRLLVMETKGKSVRLYLPVYYCLDLEHIQKETYLLPEDYDYLMSTLQYLINSGELIRERTIISPENYGFDIYCTNMKELWKGPDIIGRVRFISGKSWFFKMKVRLKYGKRL